MLYNSCIARFGGKNDFPSVVANIKETNVALITYKARLDVHCVTTVIRLKKPKCLCSRFTSLSIFLNKKSVLVIYLNSFGTKFPTVTSNVIEMQLFQKVFCFHINKWIIYYMLNVICLSYDWSNHIFGARFQWLVLWDMVSWGIEQIWLYRFQCYIRWFLQKDNYFSNLFVLSKRV